jgi:hypothetical protein
MLGLAFIDDTDPGVGVILIISDSLAPRGSYAPDAGLADILRYSNHSFPIHVNGRIRGSTGRDGIMSIVFV